MFCCIFSITVSLCPRGSEETRAFATVDHDGRGGWIGIDAAGIRNGSRNSLAAVMPGRAEAKLKVPGADTSLALHPPDSNAPVTSALNVRPNATVAGALIASAFGVPDGQGAANAWAGIAQKISVATAAKSVRTSFNRSPLEGSVHVNTAQKAYRINRGFGSGGFGFIPRASPGTWSLTSGSAAISSRRGIDWLDSGRPRPCSRPSLTRSGGWSGRAGASAIDHCAAGAGAGSAASQAVRRDRLSLSGAHGEAAPVQATSQAPLPLKPCKTRGEKDQRLDAAT